MDIAHPHLQAAIPVCNCHRRRNSLPGPGKFNTVHTTEGHQQHQETPFDDDDDEDDEEDEEEEQQQQPQKQQDIPEQYIVDQLHRLATFYWNKQESADCTIQVPVDHRRLSRTAVFHQQQQNNNLVDIRRGSEPVSRAANPKQFTKFKLHQFYLTAQSSLLRAVLSGSSVLDLNSGEATSTPTVEDFYHGRVSISSPPPLPSSRLPRLLPSPPHNPAIFLPLPDPGSFPHIIHYMYFGTTVFIQEGLTKGLISWEGVVKNVEYLGLFEGENGIRRWLAAWKHHQEQYAAYYSSVQAQFGAVREEEEGSEYSSTAPSTWSSTTSQSSEWESVSGGGEEIFKTNVFAQHQAYRGPDQHVSPLQVQV